jgi:hypothetical protein
VPARFGKRLEFLGFADRFDHLHKWWLGTTMIREECHARAGDSTGDTA